MKRFSYLGVTVVLTFLACTAPASRPLMAVTPAPQKLAQAASTRQAEAEALLNQGKAQLQASQYRAALELFLKALTAYREAQDRKGEVKALRNLGNVFYYLGNSTQAIEYYQQSLAIARTTQDREGEGSALQNLGAAYDSLADYAKAVAYIQQSIQLYRDSKDRAGEGQSLGNLANVYLAQGDYRQSIEYNQQALALARETKDRETEGNTLGNLGLAYYSLGDYPKAIDYHQQHLAIARSRQDRYVESAVLNNLGNDYHALGDYGKALESHQQSLALAQKIGNRRGIGQSSSNLGTLYLDLGEFGKALVNHEKSLAIAREIKDRQAEGQSLGNLGNVYLALSQPTKALSYHQQRLAIAQEIGDQAGQGIALNNIGNAYKVLGQYPEAIQSFQKALIAARARQDRLGEGSALGNLGVIYQVQKNHAKAIEHHQQALVIARSMQDRPSTAIYLNNLGNAYFSANQASAAEKTLREALQVWESLRVGLGNNDAIKISIFDQQARTYRLLQRVLVAENKPEAALEIAERGRARSFVELLTRRFSTTTARDQAVQTVKPPTIEQIKQIAKARNSTLVEYSITYEDVEVDGKEIPKESALLIWVVKPSGEIVLRQVDLKPLWKEQKGETFSLLAGVVSRSRGDIVQGRGLAFKENPAALARATAAIQSRPAQARTTQKLYELLIQPIADLLPTDPQARVTFIPQASLFLVPFVALQDAAGKYLIEKHTILTAPSIQVLELTRQQQQRISGKAKETLVVGNPTMPKVWSKVDEAPEQLDSLPGAEKEAKAIAALFKTQALTGQQATKAEVIRRMGTARLIHLATHGLLDDFKGLGMPGAIALAPDGKEGGLLTADEILDLKLNAELVVLSACDTGQGRLTGDGVIGLSRSLISAGVPSVIVSLWKVPDVPTATLMIEFYQQLQRNPDKAQALRQAMLATMQQYPDISAWAAFTLIGES
ncbi:MAG: CHAT domain-containing tetratricopeptide repeat protein [Leptolyngbyaceae bacterium]|nr:CHAT domain-containing tetratricopeptide repeat protein [Leptolyngbyaceae bacterium]